MKIKKFVLFVAVVLISSTSFGVQSQTDPGEDECDFEIFTGTVTYADGVPDPFDWECHGDFTDCTEVYIICPPSFQP